MAYHNRSNNYRPNNNRRPSYNNNSNDRPTYPAIATTPYNFVTPVSKPLFHPILIEQNNIEEWLKLDKKLCQEKFSTYVATNGIYTGYIDLTIKTLSPCFIGGDKKDETMEFFTTDTATDGTPVIPGSSLRGMFKNIFKIITCGVMCPNEDFDDRHLYFRKIMPSTTDKDDDTLQTHYNELTNKDNGGTKAGFLVRVKDTGKYFICPALHQKTETIPPSRNSKGGIYFYDGIDDKLPYAVCTTGTINNEQHRHYITNPDFSKDARIPLNPELHIVENYAADKTRRGVDVIKAAKKGNAASGFTKQSDINLVTPCFFTEKDGYVQNFGHGPRYRVPYTTSIKYHVLNELLAGDTPLDFADMVFGNKDYWATRVFFEDAKPADSTDVGRDDTSYYTRPLMAPNPTSYQFYLQQNGYIGKNHWDTPQANIRGYKFYWHRFTDDNKNLWMKPKEDKIINGMKKIRPIKENSIFHGKVRFENLSELELGALCSAIAFQYDNHKIAYKIGMGKSIGMGSISVEPKLFIEDMNQHYRQLFAEDNGGWRKDCSEQDMHKPITTFEQYRSQHLGPKGKDALHKTLEELATLLDYANKDTTEWLDKTSMMHNRDKRFTNRIALLDAIKFSQVKLK